jgi:3-hydroxyisobutyrate dehydrogenase-like beta-hydroxyacid dehydrogenase
VIVGLVHPGEMGAAIGRQLLAAGHDVVWASDGRSEATRERAEPFRDVSSPARLADEAEVVLSVCPPHAALDVARALRGFDGLYVDANAISPMRAQEVAALQPRFVDGGIVGGPPDEPGTTLYLSGADAPAAAALFDGTLLATRIVADASAVKMTYAAWTKGTAALLLAIRDVAARFGVEDEWRLATPELRDRLAGAERSAAAKGWRWIGEMEEIADTFAAAGQPDGFHRAAAEVYRG